jgi:hypothetical protein
MPFHQRLEECFAEMQNHVESKYGTKVIATRVIHSVRKVHQWCIDVFFSFVVLGTSWFFMFLIAKLIALQISHSTE